MSKHLNHQIKDNNSDWYTIPKTFSGNGEDDDNDYNYCSFCLINFSKYNDVINNICQVCGRVNIKVTQDKQQAQQLTAVNAVVTSETEQSTMRGISMRINYSSLTSQDETKKAVYSGNTHASFNSFKEAQEYLNRISDVSNRTLNAAVKRQKQNKYYVTSSSGSNKGFDFILPEDDNNKRTLRSNNEDDDSIF